MTCGPMVHAWEDPAVCPTGFGNYSGLEFTTHIGPYPGLFYFSDLSLRFVGGLVAAPFIEYCDSVPNLAFLNSTAYPVVRGVADFYASYATRDSNGTYHIPFGCAQEICGPANVDENDSTPDLALARMVLAAAVRYAAVLQRDAAKVGLWQKVLSGLASYATTTAQDGSNRTIFAEGRAMAPGQGIPWSGNARYPVDYFAPMHPAGQVGLTAPPDLLRVARDTVDAINAVNKWHPTNGLCMAWPPATRVANSSRAAALLDHFEAALSATLQRNLYPSLGGGGIEQVGGTLAVNELMLQSFEGFLRFFPAWPPGERGGFRSLRALGGVLVDADVDAGGTVANVVLQATVAANVTLLAPASFGAGAPLLRCGAGKAAAAPGGGSAAAPGASFSPCGTAPGESGGTLYCAPLAAGQRCEVLPASGSNDVDEP